MDLTPFGYRLPIGAGYPGGIQITLEPGAAAPTLAVENVFPISAYPPIVGVDRMTATRTGPSTVAAPACLTP